MEKRHQIRDITRHGLTVALGILPLYLALVGIQAAIFGKASSSLGNTLATGLFYWSVYVLPIVTAGILHLVLVQTIVKRTSSPMATIAAVLSTLLLPLAVLITGERFAIVFAHPFVLSVTLVSYGLLTVRSSVTPRSADSASDTN